MNKTIAVGAALVCTAIFILWTSQAGSDADVQAGAKTKVLPRTAAPENTPPSSRIKVDDKHVLTVRVIHKGEPVSCKISWVSATSPRTAFFSLGIVDSPESQAQANRVDHEVKASIEVSNGHWTWLRAKTDSAIAFALATPDETEVVIDLGQRRLDVLLLNEDLSTPVVKGDVRVYAESLGQRAMTGEPITQKTNRHGFVCFQDLSPGSFLVLGPGAGYDSGSPFGRRVILPKDTRMRSMPIILIAKAERRTANLTIHASFEPVMGEQHKLYLRRKDDSSGALYPVSGTLRPGQHTVPLSLPSGTYQLGVVPEGPLVVDPETEMIQIDDTDRDFVVHVWKNPDTTTVTLRGVDIGVFPIRVHARIEGAIVDDRVEMMRFGHMQWNKPETVVPRIKGVRRLVALGHGKNYIARDAIALDGSSVEVEMVEATRLRVQWMDWNPEHDRGATLVIDSEYGSFSRSLTPKLAMKDGIAIPAMTGDIVVPKSDLLVTCYRSEGTKAWSRKVTARSNWTMLEIMDSKTATSSAR